VQPLDGTGEVEFFGYGEETAQMPKFHSISSISL
jgi:hypothetical protein